MDEGFSKAVVHVFVKLYEQGLLYRDKRLVNWDPGLKTAISDLEVETREVQGKFWHLRYPLEDGSGFIAVATTRPETMLADMAVAVNPTDERYTDLIGRKVRLPITGRLIPIVADDHADPELGSGAVKITPGHDFNDFEVGRRAGFSASEMLNMLDDEAKVVQTADGLIPADYLGLDRFEARRLIVDRLEADGTLTNVEDRTIQTPFGDRSGAVIEPWLTDQWYVDAKTLAQPAIDAVRDGRIKVVPETWAKTWFNWLENIQPWCVSRQLWWGHRIPAWYDEDGNVFVAEDEAKAKDLAGPRRALTRDEDVLDTWFSSALWPFGTLGWPDVDPRELGRYPNDVLISGFDILFFWDARMAMQGMHFLQDVPFKTLYLHGLVRDATGAKMSKSKGNTVDPLGLIDQYGADALRFTLAAMESQGRDIKLDERRVEGYRNFATKLWNAARFLAANGVGPSTSLEAPSAQAPVNRWIIAETVATVQALDLALADLRFDEAANTLYQFVWSRFCDWYIELAKPILGTSSVRAEPVEAPSLSSEETEEESTALRQAQGERDGEYAAEETRRVAGWAFDQILVMLHPFMPFITEELWHAGGRSSDLITAQWPMADAKALDPEAAKEIDWLIRLVSGIRAARAELNVPPGAKLTLMHRDATAGTQNRINRQTAAIMRLARVESPEFELVERRGVAQVVIDEATFVLPLEGVIDIEAERSRLAKGKAAAEKERDGLAGRLSNPSFVERAKPEAVEKARTDHAEKSAEAERLGAALARLG
jgi:valyl-tRNA synthetase